MIGMVSGASGTEFLSLSMQEQRCEIKGTWRTKAAATVATAKRRVWIGEFAFGLAEVPFSTCFELWGCFERNFLGRKGEEDADSILLTGV